MKDLLEKLGQVERSIADSGRPFDLFALFSSEEEEEGAWDIVVSALWMNESRTKALEYLYDKIKAAVTEEEFKLINNIQTFDVYDPRVKELQDYVNVEHGLIELDEYKFYGFIVDKIYIITAKLQFDRELLNKVWQIITEIWNSGAHKIQSEEILDRLNAHGVAVPDYFLDRVLDYLSHLKVIHGARYVNTQAIKAHGAMIITDVNADWTPEKPLTQTGEEEIEHERTWWLYQSQDGYNWNRVDGPFAKSEVKNLAYQQHEAAVKSVRETGQGWLFTIINYDQGIEAPLDMKGTQQQIVDRTASRL